LINIVINDQPVIVEEGTTVAAAILTIGTEHFRRSVRGEPRGPLCGMGVCFECRVTIDDVPHQRSCNILAGEGMVIATDE
jgi:predicted molibdopterin-dependent oxidoreductase YjgC